MKAFAHLLKAAGEKGGWLRKCGHERGNVFMIFTIPYFVTDIIRLIFCETPEPPFNYLFVSLKLGILLMEGFDFYFLVVEKRCDLVRFCSNVTIEVFVEF